MARSGLKNFATFAGSFAVSGTCIYMLGNYLPFYVVTVSGDSMQVRHSLCTIFHVMILSKNSTFSML